MIAAVVLIGLDRRGTVRAASLASSDMFEIVSIPV